MRPLIDEPTVTPHTTMSASSISLPQQRESALAVPHTLALRSPRMEQLLTDQTQQQQRKIDELETRLRAQQEVIESQAVHGGVATASEHASLAVNHAVQSVAKVCSSCLAILCCRFLCPADRQTKDGGKYVQLDGGEGGGGGGGGEGSGGEGEGGGKLIIYRKSRSLRSKGGGCVSETPFVQRSSRAARLVWIHHLLCHRRNRRCVWRFVEHNVERFVLP